MALSPDQLMQALGRAKSIQNTLNSASPQKSPAKGQMHESYGVPNYDSLLFSSPAPSYQQRAATPNPYNSAMPQAIKESMMNHQIDANPLNQLMPLKEQTYATPQYATAPVGFDYSIIKAIVNECLNEYFSKNKLNENATLTGISLKEGKIKLVDNQSNVYSANLEYKGKIKK